MNYCLYCGEGYEDNKELVAHRKICIKNPKSEFSIEKIKAQIKAEYRAVVEGVDTYDAIFKLIEDFVATKGYTIEWTSKPNKWTPDIQEHFYSNEPVIEAEDKRYAGWTGDFKGNIIPIEGFENRDGRRCSFWDLNGEMSGRYNFKFLRTSGGSWGENFTGKGYLLVNDFPKLHQQFKGRAKTGQVTEDINKAVDTIFSEVRRKEREMIDQDKYLTHIRDLDKKMQSMRTTMLEIKGRYERGLTKNFKAETKVILPIIENPFIDMSSYNNLRDSFESTATVNLETEKIKGAIESMEDVYKDFVKFQDEHSEHFI